MIHNKKPWIFIVVFCVFILSACQTSGTARLNGENLSLNEIRTNINKVTGEFRKISQNQRDFYSQYFSPSDDPKFDPQRSASRFYAKFTIYGDRRPYDIEVVVIVEKKGSDGRYYESHRDQEMADKLIQDLKINLNKSLENRNIIDDFRVF